MNISEKVLKKAEIAEKIRRFAAKSAEKVLKKYFPASRQKVLKKCCIVFLNTHFSALFCLKKTLLFGLRAWNSSARWMDQTFFFAIFSEL